MAFLRNLYRKNFVPAGKRLLLELFDSELNVQKGLVLEEIGLPSGQAVIYRWWRNDNAAFHQQIEKDLKARSESVSNVVTRSREEFNELILGVKKADDPPLKHFAGNVRDGVFFSVAWGQPYEVRYLSIRNPPLNSRHEALIRYIKERTWL